MDYLLCGLDSLLPRQNLPRLLALFLWEEVSSSVHPWSEVLLNTQFSDFAAHEISALSLSHVSYRMKRRFFPVFIMIHSLGTHDNRALAVTSTPQKLLTQEVALFVLSRQD